MAWPPPVLPINRTNADPQQNTHPNDHNAISLAMNDTVAYVQSLGNPWRGAEVVNATMPGFPLSGSVADIGLTNVVGNLASYTVFNGHPAITFNWAAVVVGVLDIQIAAPAADGGVLVNTVWSGLFVATNQLPVLAGIPAQFQIPLAGVVGASQPLYWEINGLATAQSFASGQLRIWEAGTLTNTKRT